MAAGDSEVKKITIDGRTVTDRTPTKKLNPFIAANLKATLLRPDVSVKLRRQPGVDSYYVTDNKGKVLFVYINGWDYGHYMILLNEKVVAETDWYENDNHTNNEQQEIFDIFNAITTRGYDEEVMKAAEKALTAEEIEALKILNFGNKNQK